MSAAFAHPLHLSSTVHDICSAAGRMAAEGYWRNGSLSNGNSVTEVRGVALPRPIASRLLSRKNSRNLRHAQLRCPGLASRLSTARRKGFTLTPPSVSFGAPCGSDSDHDGREWCGCGARSQIFGQGTRRKAQHSARLSVGLDGRGVAMADRKRNLVLCERGTVTKKSRQRSRWKTRHSGVGYGENSEGRRKFTARIRSTFGARGPVEPEDRKLEKLLSGKWSFMSAAAAAAAATSLSLCSSAQADPVTQEQIQVPTTPFSEDLRMLVETKLRRELQMQIKLPKDWLDEIRQPLSGWSIDDRVTKNLEERSRSGLDESGKLVSRLEILESEVAPIFKPLAVAQGKEKVARAGNTRQGPAQEIVLASSQSPPLVAVQLRNTTTVITSTPKASKPALDCTAETVAVAAIPLGSVVSAASRTVTAPSVSKVQAGGAVPGMSLLTKIMMHFGGGGVAGAMGATLVYPLDTIKTRMQAQSNKDGGPAQYKGEWDCLRRLVVEEGPGSLYSGLVPQLLGIAPEKAMKLTVNDVLMELLESQMPGVGTWALELIAGGGGGFSQVVFTNPMEIIKVRLQTQAKSSQPKNTWDVIKELGVQGLYNGSLVTMARDIPSSAIFFAIYTLIRQIYPDQSFLAGFVAAIPATVLVTPFDVVKTRLQMERTDGDGEYENGYECFNLILRKEGIGALFTGSLARVLKTSPQFGITLMLYDILCKGF